MKTTDSNNKNPPDKDPGTEGTDKGNNKVALFDAVFGALELFALVFWILSEKIHGRWVLHSLLLSIATICFLCGGAHLLHKILKRTKLVWSLCCLLCVAVAYLIFKLSVPESTLPRLTFAFSPGGNEADVELIDAFFFKKRGLLRPQDVRGVLMVPINPGQSNSVLSFALLNKDGPFCELSELQLQSDASPPIAFGKGWTSLESPPP